MKRRLPGTATSAWQPKQLTASETAVAVATSTVVSPTQYPNTHPGCLVDGVEIYQVAELHWANRRHGEHLHDKCPNPNERHPVTHEYHLRLSHSNCRWRGRKTSRARGVIPCRLFQHDVNEQIARRFSNRGDMARMST